MNSFLSPFRIVLCFLVFALLGVFVIPFLKVELNPSPKLHSLTVRFSLPNSSPEIVENQATAPLENAISTITHLKEINSISNYNQGQITLKFDKETDLQLKKFEVSMLIRQIYPTLISSLSYPLVEVSDGQNKQEKTPSLTYSINAPFSAFEIKNKLESTIKPYFSSISEIEEVEIKTPSNQILKIKYNQDKLNAYNLTEEKLKQQLQTLIETSYLGFYSSTNNATNFWVQVPPSFSVSSLNNFILSQQPLIRFSDVASFDFEEDIPTSFYRINGKQAITLSFFVRSESNKIKVVNEIKSRLENLNLPKDYQIFKEYDETEYLEKELDKTYKRALLSVLVLCSFILLLERNLKYLFVLLSSLLVNILITALFAYFLKINIHLYSLAGIAISFGLILDNAIVMLNELHHNSKNQTKNNTNSKQTITNLFLALFAASLTTISALLLVFFLPEEDQKNLLDFASIVALTIFVSLPIALWFTPSLYLLLFKNTLTAWKLSATYTKKRIVFYIFKGYIFIIEFLQRFKKAVIFGLILLFGTPIFLLPPKIEEKQNEITFYGNLYNQTIGSKLYQEEIRPHSDAYLGGMLRLFVRYAYEKFSYREAEQIQLYVQAKMPEGTTILQMNEALKTIENFLKNENSTKENIAKFVTQVYTRQGRIIISFSEKQEKSNYPIQLKNKLIARSIDLDGVKWNIYGVGHQGFSTPDQTKMTSFRVQLKGYNYLQVEQEAEKLAQKLLTHKRIQEVNTNERNSYFEKTDRVIFLNPSLKELAYQNQSSLNLTNFLEQKTPSAYSEVYLPYQNGFIPTKIEDEKANDFSFYDIKSGGLTNSTNYSEKIQIPFSTFSTLKTQVAANSIYKENRQYLRIVGYDYFGSTHFGQTHLDKTLQEFEPTLPLGYSFKQLDTNFYSSPEKAQKQYGLLGILMLLIFFICSILFESLRQAFLILCVVPLSFIGIFITFGEFQIYFDQGGYASFVLVGGLCVNASIFIINDYNFLKKQKNNRNAFYKATFKKAVPIFLTVISTFLGLTPFLWEGQSEIFWFSLAAGTTGGLIFSIFCVFFVLPIFFIEETKKFR